MQTNNALNKLLKLGTLKVSKVKHAFQTDQVVVVSSHLLQDLLSLLEHSLPDEIY